MRSTNIADAYPLSPMQESFLFHSLSAPQSGVYVTQVACTLNGLNVAAFQQGWQAVMERHAILRTAFAWQSVEKPLQVVGRRVHLPLVQHDWRGLEAAAQEAQWEAYLQADRRRGFQLSRAPLMRLALFRMRHTTYKFVWSHHHILLDGWSVALLLKEVLACYEAFACGQHPQLKAPRPYRDYIAWLQQQDASQAALFWHRTLQGCATPILLGGPQTAGREPTKEVGYAEQTRQISPDTTAALRALARQYRVTLYTVVEGAWALLLSHISGQQDIVFGTVTAGRPATLGGIESMVGLFLNILPVRVQISPEAAFQAWLQQLQVQQVARRQYEYCTLDQMQQWSGLPPQVPLFESIVRFQNYPTDDILGEHRRTLQIDAVRITDTWPYSLDLVVVPGATLRLCLTYDRSRFDVAMITQMLEKFQGLLAGMPAHPLQRLAGLLAPGRGKLVGTGRGLAGKHAQTE
jgi:surfactin family lipopeptide synthetase C